ncbi:MAG: UbiH/UbiF/VisC/COQ6 family ubiquinone biosynthesis hydroxylase [Gammaproteobacteria bacterium]|nr:UbiH/UbiF/VisC/COQ6 family ubiquinone biosynthesis hydroxylase [Gammaproteobacteria bacterium]MDE1886958.1 UbiH/UbiF/VisC/COQ6 family ubiquinone biosynthesis hydroxylase [Gammaproteobacteria bacterium]MDE2273988.1 UbiH/UbiF/VisC/COQ6 family ubiquinone biosynthesis hydroxylase [Gammaproteobacteria bacterium]
MKQEFDLIIVGAGVVGAALAAALCDSGLRIAILDAREPPRLDPKADWDLRVFALSPASRQLLDAVGAWKSIPAGRVCAYTAMQVWDAMGRGRIQFDCAEVGAEALGYIVENRQLQHALWQRLEHARTLTAIFPARPEAVHFDAQHVVLSLEGGSQLHARLLVAADGADSAVRKLAGIETTGASYRQQAVVAHLFTEKPHRNTARQRFLPSGPLALLPLADGRVSLVWSLDDARAEEVRALDDAQFCAAVAEGSGHVLGHVTGTTKRAAFPLQRLRVRAYVRPHLALIGDAAHALHPLAGQGMNLGLLDAATLSGVLHAAAAHERDIGDLAVLRRYERERRGANLAMIMALDGFKRVFSNDIRPVALLRNAGLSAVNRFTPLKSAFMRHAMGLNARLPAPTHMQGRSD